MSDYANELLSLLQKSFDAGEFHYDFSIPEDSDDYKKLNNALNELENACKILILASPEVSGNDFIEVEMYPPCCGPLLKDDYFFVALFHPLSLGVCNLIYLYTPRPFF